MGAIVIALIVAAVSIASAGMVSRLAPPLAKAMVRRAALWWHSDLDSPAELAEEWLTLIDECPARPVKVITALSLLMRATFRHGVSVGRPAAGNLGWMFGRLAGAYIKALIAVFAWWRGLRPHGAKPAAIAVGLFMLGTVLGQWLVIAVAILFACGSQFYNSAEKWVVLVLVPIATLLIYAIGFWLHQRGIWGGHAVSTSDLLAGFASFFGTLPRIAATLEALFLSWRLARGLARSKQDDPNP